MPRLKEFWSMGKTEGLFENDFYSEEGRFAYHVCVVYRKLSGDYFSLTKRLKRWAFACVRMSQQQRNPVFLEVIGKEHSTRVDLERYVGEMYEDELPLLRHLNDEIARGEQYIHSGNTIEGILRTQFEAATNIRFVT